MVLSSMDCFHKVNPSQAPHLPINNSSSIHPQIQAHLKQHNQNILPTVGY